MRKLLQKDSDGNTFECRSNIFSDHLVEKAVLVHKSKINQKIKNLYGIKGEGQPCANCKLVKA